jgi:hypothetical protein
MISLNMLQQVRSILLKYPAQLPPNQKHMSDNYLDRDCDLTLQQALDKYYAKNPDFYQPNQLDDDSRRVFFAHDVCHIIFGCDTSLVGEAKVEQWTIHSTNFSFKEYVDTVLSTEATLQAVTEISPIQVLG